MTDDQSNGLQASTTILKDAIRTYAFVRDSIERPVVAPDEQNYDSWLFDFRSIVLQPKILEAYADIFWQQYGDRYPFQVGGMETAAIPLVSAIVLKSAMMKKPVNGFYIRKSRKRTGLLKYIEGTLTKDPIILVDDLINNGGSLEKLIKILEDVGAHVTDIFVMLAFRDRTAYGNIPESISLQWLFSLSDFDVELSERRTRILAAYKEVWRYKAPQPSLNLVVQKSAPVLDDERIYFGCDDGKFRALNKETGELAWEFAIQKHPRGKAILSSPAIYEDTVYFGAYDGNIYALDRKTGAPRWTYDYADWIGSSPALSHDLKLVYIGLEFGLFRKRGGLAAISMKNGEEIWRTDMPELTHGSPLYIREHDLVVLGSNDGIFYGYSATTGETRFQFPTNGGIKSAPAYDHVRELILFGSMDSQCYAIDPHGVARFALQAGGGIYSTPLVHEDLAYVASLDKTIYAIDLDSGKQSAQFTTGGRIFASPILAANSIWIGSNDGRLYELDPRTLRDRGHFQASERIVSKVAYDEHRQRIFIPTVANEIYCIERA